VRDLSASVEFVSREKADAGRPGSIAAPFSGAVSPTVAEGDKVTAGQTVATIEAMKMESSITSPIDGTVKRVAVRDVETLGGGDLVLEIE